MRYSIAFASIFMCVYQVSRHQIRQSCIADTRQTEASTCAPFWQYGSALIFVTAGWSMTMLRQKLYVTVQRHRPRASLRNDRKLLLIVPRVRGSSVHFFYNAMHFNRKVAMGFALYTHQIFSRVNCPVVTIYITSGIRLFTRNFKIFIHDCTSILLCQFSFLRDLLKPFGGTQLWLSDLERLSLKRRCGTSYIMHLR